MGRTGQPREEEKSNFRINAPRPPRGHLKSGSFLHRNIQQGRTNRLAVASRALVVSFFVTHVFFPNIFENEGSKSDKRVATLLAGASGVQYELTWAGACQTHSCC